MTKFHCTCFFFGFAPYKYKVWVHFWCGEVLRSAMFYIFSNNEIFQVNHTLASMAQ